MAELTRSNVYDQAKIIEINGVDYETTTQKKGRDYIEYYEIPASYDIETSSFRNDQGDPVMITYAHMLNVDGFVFKWEEWEDTKRAFDSIKEALGLSYTKRLIVYVHNLSYEFQAMKKHFKFAKVFNNGGERKILTAETYNGIEFRCSYMLSGSNLAQVAKNLNKYKIEKLDGDLDYNLIRTPLTEITDEELQYMINDVVIIEYYIRECMAEEGGITKIPLTNTGRVRKYTKSLTIDGKTKEAKQYRDLIRNLTIDPEEYKALRRAFAGGFTHANIANVKQTKHDVTARDFASSYPARMITYQYPMSKGEEVDIYDYDDFLYNIDNYCCLFYIRFNGINRVANEAYISASKTTRSSNMTVNNGRVESASFVEMWITEVDLKSIILSYDIDDYEVYKLYRYKRGYLPKQFIEAIIKLYEDKTMLKDVEGYEAEYKNSKGMLNSLFGMCVQEIVQDDYEWDDLHKSSTKETADVYEKLDKHNKKRNRFLYYPWGVWITAYARYDLFQDVVQLGDDYVYCDTDSVYYTNEDKHEHIFETSNDRINRQLKEAADYHGIDVNRLSPKDPKGIPHTIGLWDLDGRYKRFKTLGAKRYMVEDHDGNVNITVSGINKSSAVPYLKETYGDGIFEAFDEHLHVPEGSCGKSTHTYIDASMKGTVIDYQGTPYDYEELSGTHLEETSYTMTISNEYSEMIEYIQQIKSP